MEHSTITSKGQTTVPHAIRQHFDLKPGDRLIWDERDGEIVLKIDPGVRAVVGMLHDDIKASATEDFAAERAAADGAWVDGGLRGFESDDAPFRR